MMKTPTTLLFSVLMSFALGSQAVAGANLNIVCAERYSPYMKGGRDFFIVKLREDQDMTEQELRDKFFNKQGIVNAQLVVTHHRGLRYQEGDDVASLHEQMTKENQRGEPMLLRSHIGLGSMSYTGPYFPLDSKGAPLSEDEKWIRFPYRATTDMTQSNFSIHFARGGTEMKERNLLLKSYTCAAPRFFNTGREDTSVVPPADDMASGAQGVEAQL